MKIKGAIFDLDGTLVDSMPLWETLAYKYLIGKGLTPEHNLSEIMKTMSLIQAADYFRSTYKITDSSVTILNEINAMIEYQYRESVPLKKGVEALLKKLAQKNVKMCIATANDKKLTEIVVNRLGINSYFNSIITCTELGIGKDCPDFFLKALEYINTPIKETCVFEDSLHAIKNAKVAGFVVMAVYDKSAQNDYDEIIKTADLYIDSFDETEILL